MTRALAASVLVLACLAPASVDAQSAEDVHALPIRQADRPLTLPMGTLRLEQSVVLRLSSTIGVSGPNALYAGLTDWLEIGVSWPWTRDPTFLVTARVAHGRAVDLGVRVAVTAPAITTGDTDLVVSMPVVFRIAHVARIALTVTGDFLLTQPMSPIVRVPLQVTLSGSARHAVILEGSVSLVERRFWHGSAGILYSHTSTATAIRPLVEEHLGFEAAWGNNTVTFLFSAGFTFWGTVIPTSS